MRMAVPIAQPRVPHRELIERARAGEQEGIAGLYARHAPQLFRLAFRLTGSEADAEDIVHDLFVGLPEALTRYKEQGSFESWLKRVTVRLALMHMRAAKRRREVPLEAAPPLRSRSSKSTTAERFDLKQAIAALPTSLRAVLVLKQIEGYSHTEIGQLLGITSGASRARFARAVRMLRRMLRTEE